MNKRKVMATTDHHSCHLYFFYSILQTKYFSYSNKQIYIFNYMELEKELPPETKNLFIYLF